MVKGWIERRKNSPDYFLDEEIYRGGPGSLFVLIEAEKVEEVKKLLHEIPIDAGADHLVLMILDILEGEK